MKGPYASSQHPRKEPRSSRPPLCERPLSRLHLRPARILYLTNEDAQSHALRKLLAAKHQVALAPLGHGLDVRRLPDMLLCDVSPQMDYRFITRLKADPDTCLLPIMLIGGKGGEEDMVRGFEAGADDYLDPPFSEKEFLLRINNHLSMARLRKEAQEKIKRLNTDLNRRVAEFETLLQVLPIGIGIAYDKHCEHIKVNAAFADQLNLAPEENASLTAAPSHRPSNFKVLRKGKPVEDRQLPMQVAAREGRTIRNEEFDILHADGRVVRLLEYAAPLFDETGRPSGSVGAFVDITGRKEAEEALRRSERKLRLIMNAAPVLISYIDYHGRYVLANHTYRRWFGMDPDGMRGKHVREVMGDETYQIVEPYMKRALAGQDVRFEAELPFRQGGMRSALISYTPDIGADGRVRGFVSLLNDITDRRAAEAQLKEERQALEALNKLGRSMASTLDLESIVQMATDEACHLTGAKFGAFFYNVTNANGKSYTLYTLSGAPREAFDKFPMPRATPMFGPTFRGEGTVCIDDVRQDTRYGKNPPYHGMPEGHLPVTSYLAVPVISRTGEVLGGLFFGHPEPGVFKERAVMIAEGIAAQAAISMDNARLYESLAQSEGDFRQIAEGLPQIVWVARPDGMREYYNHRWHEYTGLDEKEAGHQWLDPVHPDDIPRVEQAWKYSVETGKPYEVEHRLKSKTGEFRWFLGRALPLRSRAGKINRWFGTSTDIHDRILFEQELRHSKERAEAANQAKSDFLANMSHEIRTPMNAVVGLANILTHTNLVGRQKDFVSTLKTSAESLMMLINDMLDFTKLESNKVQLEEIPFHPATLIKECVKIVSVDAQKKSILLTTHEDCSADLELVGDPHRLRQVVMNLLSNAVKFTDHGGITLTLRCPPPSAGKKADLSITVQDTGIGMNEATQRSVFEKFTQADASTTRKYGGTGLGLAISKSLVELMGGSITVKSKLGQGSTFRVALSLPISPKQKPATPSKRVGRGAPVPRGGRILLVEDYEANVLVAETILQDFGYRCDVVHNGTEALQQLNQHRYDLILMDIQMQGMDGFETTRQIRRLERADKNHPHVPIIAMTAYALGGDRERALQSGMDDYISKPFDPEDLKQKLERHLARASAA